MISAQEARERTELSISKAVAALDEHISKAIASAIEKNQYRCVVNHSDVPMTVTNAAIEQLRKLGYQVSGGYDQRDGNSINISWGK
ncbi:hypothetical protein MT068_001469 [Salmonella enterica]|nr:hypothetical protein [Salmonella enterica]